MRKIGEGLAKGPCRKCGGENFAFYRHTTGSPKRKCRGCAAKSHAAWQARLAGHSLKFRNSLAAQARRQRRMAMIQRYGGKCACCYESNPLMLTFDHVENGGNAHRREIGTAHFGEWLSKQSDFVPGIQVLCYNCNLAKSANGGVCPHESLRAIAS